MVPTSSRLLRHSAWALVALILAALILPSTLLAHAELVTATPADKSTVTAPVTEVSGIYSEAMKPDGSSLVVKDATGTVVARGTVDPANDLRMVATPTTPLDDGTYRVESTSLATDGDVAHAIWSFTVAIAAASPTPGDSPAPTASTSPGPSAATTPAPATAIPSAGPTPVPSGAGSTTDSGSDVVLPIAIALIVLGAGAVYLLMRRGRPTDQP